VGLLKNRPNASRIGTTIEPHEPPRPPAASAEEEEVLRVDEEHSISDRAPRSAELERGEAGEPGPEDHYSFAFARDKLAAFM
jgi:hypothetical protein